MPPTAAPKPSIVSPLPPPSAEELAKRMIRLASDLDAQRAVVERAKEGEAAAAKLRHDAEDSLAKVRAETIETQTAWSRAMGLK